ncbi:MAG: hypothetical protein AAFU72_17100, partial [Pseudomonadota bacterium]
RPPGKKSPGRLAATRAAMSTNDLRTAGVCRASDAATLLVSWRANRFRDCASNNFELSTSDLDVFVVSSSKFLASADSCVCAASIRCRVVVVVDWLGGGVLLSFFAVAASLRRRRRRRLLLEPRRRCRKWEGRRRGRGAAGYRFDTVLDASVAKHRAFDIFAAIMAPAADDDDE